MSAFRAKHRSGLHYDVMFTPKSMSALQSEQPITLRRYVYTSVNVRFAERTTDYTTTLCLHLNQCPLCRANHRLHYDVMFTPKSMSALQSEPPITLRRYVYTSVNVRFAERTIVYTTTLCLHLGQCPLSERNIDQAYTTTLCLYLSQCQLCRANHRLHYDVVFTHQSMSALQSEPPITLRRYVYTSVNVRFAERTTDYTTTLCVHLSQCPLCRANHRLHYDVTFTPKSMSALQSEPSITLRRYVSFQSLSALQCDPTLRSNAYISAVGRFARRSVKTPEQTSESLTALQGEPLTPLRHNANCYKCQTNDYLLIYST